MPTDQCTQTHTQFYTRMYIYMSINASKWYQIKLIINWLVLSSQEKTKPMESLVYPRMFDWCCSIFLENPSVDSWGGHFNLIFMVEFYALQQSNMDNRRPLVSLKHLEKLSANGVFDGWICWTVTHPIPLWCLTARLAFASLDVTAHETPGAEGVTGGIPAAIPHGDVSTLRTQGLNRKYAVGIQNWANSLPSLMPPK
jgi:hypothetical protein